MAPASAHRVDPFDRGRLGRWIAVLTLAAGLLVGVPVGIDEAAAEQNASVRVTKDSSQQPFSYTPQEVSVAVGGRVTFSNPQIHTEAGAGNNAAEDHPTNCRQGTSKGKCPWNSEPMPPGEGFVLNFPDEGTFTYFCAVHPYMTGTIIVGDGDPSEPEPEPEPSQDPAPPPPSEEPSEQPSEEPEPSAEPTEAEPSDEPTEEASEEPSEEATEDDADASGEEPTDAPSAEAPAEPTDEATDDPLAALDDANEAIGEANEALGEALATGETAVEAAIKAAIRVSALFLWLFVALVARIAWRRHHVPTTETGSTS